MTKTAEANAQRLVSAVRKIAKQVILEGGLLPPAAAKAGIGKTRGAAYFNANGDIETANAVPDEAPTDSESKDGAADSSSASSTKQSVYSPISDADAAQVGDTFDQFEGYDCTTGDKLQLDLTPLPGAEYVPPDGWSDADTGPPVEGYEAGYYWVGNDNGGTTCFKTADPAAIGDYYTGLSESLVSWSLDYTVSGSISLSGCVGVYSYDAVIKVLTDTGAVLIKGYRSACGGSAADYCTIPPVVAEWPSDGITSLILKNGTLQAHSMDPDAAAAYKTNPPAEMEMCDGQGNRYSVTALDGGGAMITKLDANGDPIADGRSLIIDSAGVVTKRVLNTWREGYL